MPFGYNTNQKIYTAGNYLVSDYVKLGGPPLVAYSMVALSMIGWVYGL